MPLVSFNPVIDPRFVSSSLYTTIRNSNPNPNNNTNPNSNPNRNPTVITDPQIGLRDLQIVTVQIRRDPHFVACCIFGVILLALEGLIFVTSRADAGDLGER